MGGVLQGCETVTLCDGGEAGGAPGAQGQLRTVRSAFPATAY